MYSSVSLLRLSTQSITRDLIFPSLVGVYVLPLDRTLVVSLLRAVFTGLLLGTQYSASVLLVEAPAAV